MKFAITIPVLFLILFQRIGVAIAASDDDQAATAVDRALPKTSIKCGECPCVNSCSQQQQLLTPPPPPRITQYCPPQAPPPPRFYYFSGGLPELSQGAPPPPRFTYVVGGGPRQGNLYPTDPFNLEIYNGAVSCNHVLQVTLFLLVIGGTLQILVFYGV